MLGRKPTILLKLAGVLRLPPKSLPVASQTCFVAKATEEPPDEPPAILFLLKGFLVTPYTGLKVCPPAHSGTFDLATGSAPFCSKRAIVESDFDGILLLNIFEPNVVGTPATSL